MPDYKDDENGPIQIYVTPPLGFIKILNNNVMKISPSVLSDVQNYSVTLKVSDENLASDYKFELSVLLPPNFSSVVNKTWSIPVLSTSNYKVSHIANSIPIIITISK